MLYFWHYEVGRAAVQPIHYAAQFDHLGIYGAVWLAQQPGVSLTAADNDGCQPIHAATLNGNLEMVRWLAQQSGVSLTTEDNDGCHRLPTHPHRERKQPERLPGVPQHGYNMVQWLEQQPGVSA